MSKCCLRRSAVSDVILGFLGGAPADLVGPAEGSYHMPGYLSQAARGLINSMLAVDPVKRITIPEITQHPFFTTDLPRYLAPLPPPPGPVLGHLSSLVTPPKVVVDFEMIEGLGRVQEDIVEELASTMIGVTKDDIWECLRRDDGVQGNAVKVAYMLMRDKRRSGKLCKPIHDFFLFVILTTNVVAEYAEQEREAQEAVLDVRSYVASRRKAVLTFHPQPRNALSPNAMSPGGGDLEENPFEAEFNSEFDDEDDLEDGLDFMPLATGDDDTNPDIPTFAVLNSSLPDQFPEQHHLTSYVSAKRSGAGGREKKQHRTKWHFGIRSRSPPMEVMLEIYRTLKALGMEWKEKKNLGGLGGVKRRGTAGAGIERARDLDGEGGVDLKAAAGIYFVETRARVQDVVVRFSSRVLLLLFLDADVPPGLDEPAAVHGRFDQLSGRLPP